MMKISDVKTSIALLINGYLRANEGEEDSDKSLSDCLDAIELECRDWQENLDPQGDLNALNENEIEVNFGRADRTPYNIASAMKSLASELAALDGDEAVERVADEIKQLVAG